MACGQRLQESGSCFAFYPHNTEKGGASKWAIVPTILSMIVVLIRIEWFWIFHRFQISFPFFFQIMRDPETGNSKGYAFINFASFDASDAAIEAMNGQFLCNRAITISYAFKKEAKGERHGSAAGIFHVSREELFPTLAFPFSICWFPYVYSSPPCTLLFSYSSIHPLDISFPFPILYPKHHLHSSIVTPP